MVIVILLQVFFRYVLNNALPWPDELARFLMLWMTGFIAPSAYRWGGFVSIEMLPQMLPKLIESILMLFLLSLSLAILIIGFKLGGDWDIINNMVFSAKSNIRLNRINYYITWSIKNRTNIKNK